MRGRAWFVAAVVGLAWCGPARAARVSCDDAGSIGARLAALREARELMATYREVVAAEIERERGGLPGVASTRERFGPLTPAARARVPSIELAAARALPSEGEHDTALMYLDGAIQRVQSGPTDDGMSILRDAVSGQLADWARGELAKLARGR